jgi:hypothetical protein
MTSRSNRCSPSHVYRNSLSAYSSMGNFVSSDTVSRLRLPTTSASAYTLSFANGQTSVSDKETRPLQLSIGQHREKITLRTVHLPRHEVILGTPWLKRWNPSIDWTKNAITIRKDERDCLISPQPQPAATPRLNSITAHQFSRALRKEATEAVYLVIAKPEGPDAAPPERARHLLEEYADVFQPKLSAGLPPKRDIDHRIELTPGLTPPVRPVYRMAQTELEELQKQLDEMLSDGQIRPSRSPYGSPVLFVRKKDGSLRLDTNLRITSATQTSYFGDILG